MGEHKRRAGRPFWASNQKLVMPRNAAQPCAPLRVQAVKDIKITDKSICFVAPRADCCVDKVVKEYVPYFESEGYQIIFTAQKGMEEIIKFAPRWVVLFRVGTNPEFGQEIGLNNTVRLIKHLQRVGVRVVYYIDDFLVNANKNSPISIAALCDAIIVATTELKTFFQNIPSISVPILHVHTHVDVPVFDFVPKLDYITSIDKYKVLMTSSGRVGASLLYDMCKKAEERHTEFDDVEWIINASGVSQMRTLINEFRNLHKMYIDWSPLNAYYSLCKSVDVILNPASKEDIAYICPPQWQDAWLNSKSAVKYTMAGAARIPCLSSPMLSYTESIKDGETGYILNSADEFLDKILYLKDNKEEARRIGNNARKDIEEEYHIAKVFPKYRDAITGDLKVEDPTIGILTAKSDGGPGSFNTTFEKYITQQPNSKYRLTYLDTPSVKHILSVAFLHHDVMQAAKKRDPSIQFIQRMDGLPFVSYLGDETGIPIGEIQTSVMEVMQKNYDMADLIVWQSEFAKRVWAPYVDTTKESVIIYNGVDLNIFNTNGSKFPLADGFNVLCVNHSLFKHKRVDLIEEYVKKYPNVNFTLVGIYTDLSVITDVNIWSQFPNVTYIGPTSSSDEGRRRLASIYRAADVLMFTSEMEGCPNTVLEATACGLPVIYNEAIDVVPEILGDKCYQLKDFEDVVAGKKQPIEGLAELAKKYSAENMVKNYLEILK